MSNRIFSEEQDAKGSILVIMHSPKLALSRPYSFFLRQNADLIDNGHGMPITSWKDEECGVIWAEQEGKVVGFIVYDHSGLESRAVLSIVLTAVDPEYRGRRIYAAMHKWFEELCREMGGLYVKATVSPKNTSRLKSCEQVGLKPMFIQMYKKVN